MAAKKKTGTVKLWASPLGSTKAIAVGKDVFPVNADQSIDVPADMEKTFLKIGCVRTKPKE